MARDGRIAVVSWTAYASTLLGPDMTEIATIPTVHDLRRRWKPHKERLAALGGERPTSIRFHRACSWLAHVEQMPDGQDHDLGLVSLWIAFNALYGKWDTSKPGQSEYVDVTIVDSLGPGLSGTAISLACFRS